MKKTKIWIAAVLLQSGVAFSSVPYNYTGNNPFYEMFLTMMDMFGLIDYHKVNPNYWGGAGLSPWGYSAMPGLSPFNSINPLTSMNQVNGFNGVLPGGSTLSPFSWQGQTAALQNNVFRSPLEGVWLGVNGDILVFMGKKFFYASGKRHLTGAARIEDNKIIADIDDSTEVIKFIYELKGAYLAVRIKEQKILYFKKQI